MLGVALLSGKTSRYKTREWGGVGVGGGGKRLREVFRGTPIVLSNVLVCLVDCGAAWMPSRLDPHDASAGFRGLRARAAGEHDS